VQAAAVWPAALDLHGLVDMAYEVRVGADTPPVLPDGRVGLVWLSDGTLRVCGPETRAWRPDRVGVTAVGVRLSRGAASTVLGVPAFTLLDRRVHLRELWGAAAVELTDRLGTADGPRYQAALLQTAIRRRRAQTGLADQVASHVARRLVAEQSRSAASRTR